jgi:hypothetical protein
MVVLYYIGSDSTLFFDRRMMRKYSHLCHDKANWAMVNIAKHLMYINTVTAKRFPDPDNIILEVKRPKANVTVYN